MSPGRFTKYAWDRLIKWENHLVMTRNVHLTMQEAAAGTKAACFLESPALNGQVSRSSCAGACIRLSTEDPALPDNAISGAI